MFKTIILKSLIIVSLVVNIIFTVQAQEVSSQRDRKSVV